MLKEDHVIDLVTRQEMERAVVLAKKGNQVRSLNLGWWIFYLGIGCAFQAMVYGDFSLNQFADGSVSILALAHILIWWVFLIAIWLKWIAIAVVVGGVIFGIICMFDNANRRYRRWRWFQKHSSKIYTRPTR